MKIVNECRHGHQTYNLGRNCVAAGMDFHVVNARSWEKHYRDAGFMIGDAVGLTIGYADTADVHDYALACDYAGRHAYSITYHPRPPLEGRHFQLRKIPAEYKPPAPASGRRGFITLINGYEHWGGYDLYRQLKGNLNWYGFGSPNGGCSDQVELPKHRALVHVKYMGMCCFAVINALGLGVPVVLDHRTMVESYCNAVLKHGVNCLVGDGVAEIQSHLDRLDKDDALVDRLSRGAYESAPRLDRDYSDSFRSWCEGVWREVGRRVL